MKKKLPVILGIIIVAVCALCLSGCKMNKPEDGVEEDEAGLVYELTYKKSSYIVSSANKSVTEVIIPSEFNGLPVIGIGVSAFSDCVDLTSVEIPDSITSIKENAFRGCSNLASIVIPDSVITVGISAFENCSGLKSAVLSNSTTWLANNVFLGCVGLTEIKIPYSVNNIGERAFYGCVGLTSIEIPDSVSYFGPAAFAGCTNIATATVPTTAIASIPADNLQSVIISGGSSIENQAFSGCDNLTSIEIPNSVTTIGLRAFSGLSGLTIYCEATTAPSGWSEYWNSSDCPVVWDCKNNDKDINGYAYTVIDGIRYRLKDGEATVINQSSGLSGDRTIGASVLYNDEIYKVTSIVSGAFRFRHVTSIEIPNGVTKIESYTFCECGYLTSVEIPDSVTSIENNAFNSCSSLTSVKIPNGVTSIEDRTFSRCRGLTSIDIPNSVESIGEFAFSECGSLTRVDIPNSVTSIGNDAFWCCGSISTIIMPSSVTTIGRAAFYACDSLTEVFYGGTAAQWEAMTIDESNQSLTSAAVYYYSETQPLAEGNYWHYAADWVTPEKW